MTGPVATPTTTNDPADCICGRHAIGLGIDLPRQPPLWLCTECSYLMEEIKRIRRFDPYELKALDGGVEAVGAYLESIGKTELSEFDELERRMLVKAAWQGCADELRRLIRNGEAPF